LYILKTGTATDLMRCVDARAHIGIGLLLVVLGAGLASAQLEVTAIFSPSGSEGDYADIGLDDAWADQPISPPSCIRISYSAAQSQGQGYAGIIWQYPDSNYGSQPGMDLSSYDRLTFWARGELGGEVAEFWAGQSGDTLQTVSMTVTLSRQWQQYSLDLSGQDRSSVSGGFAWRATKDQNPLGSTIYLDDIILEEVASQEPIGPVIETVNDIAAEMPPEVWPYGSG